MISFFHCVVYMNIPSCTHEHADVYRKHIVVTSLNMPTCTIRAIILKGQFCPWTMTKDLQRVVTTSAVT